MNLPFGVFTNRDKIEFKRNKGMGQMVTDRTPNPFKVLAPERTHLFPQDNKYLLPQRYPRQKGILK